MALMDPMAEGSAFRKISCALLEHMFGYLDPGDRNPVSEVCVEWKKVDSETRTSVYVPNAFSVAPSTLSRRFPKIDTLKIRSHRLLTPGPMSECPTAACLQPWSQEIATSYKHQLKSLTVRGITVTDDDLILLSKCCSKSLTTLRLKNCTGFTTKGLSSITMHCRLLEVLHVELSYFVKSDQGDTWLRNLAEPHSKIRELNLRSGRVGVDLEDVAALINQCQTLRSLTMSDWVSFRAMSAVLNRATALVELGPGHFHNISETEPWRVSFPNRITSLCELVGFNDLCLPISPTTLGNLRSLDIWAATGSLSPAGHIEILRYCVNIETLQVGNDLGDNGLTLVATTCVNLKRIKVQCGMYNPEQTKITPRGIIPLVQGCTKLEHLLMYVSDLNNATLAAIGNHCHAMKKLHFFGRDVDDNFTPLDEGVKLLLEGCRQLESFGLSLGSDALTYKGLAYIGKYGKMLKRICLHGACEAHLGDVDLGIYVMVTSCRNLETLELHHCPVSEQGLADTIRRSNSVKYLRATGSLTTNGKGQCLARCRQNWVVEYAGTRGHFGAEILAYSTITQPRPSPCPGITVLTS